MPITNARADPSAKAERDTAMKNYLQVRANLFDEAAKTTKLSGVSRNDTVSLLRKLVESGGTQTREEAALELSIRTKTPPVQTARAFPPMRLLFSSELKDLEKRATFVRSLHEKCLRTEVAHLP